MFSALVHHHPESTVQDEVSRLLLFVTAFIFSHEDRSAFHLGTSLIDLQLQTFKHDSNKVPFKLLVAEMLPKQLLVRMLAIEIDDRHFELISICQLRKRVDIFYNQ